MCLCFFIAKKAVYHAYAERQFTKGQVLTKHCNEKQTKACLHAAKYMRQATEYNKEEYFYKYSLALATMKIYDYVKDKRLLAAAAGICKKAKKHSWDKHYPHVCLAKCYMKAGNRRKALENLEAARVYIPHNEKLLGYIEKIR